MPPESASPASSRKTSADRRHQFDFVNDKLAYYKPPGWIVFIDRLPKTSTPKVQKTEIFPKTVDPTTLPDAFDLRSLKKRGGPS